MSIFNKKYLKLSGDYVVRKIDDEIFAVPIGEVSKNFVIQLNDVALEAWKLLENGISYEKLINYFITNYNVELNQIKTDLNALLVECLKNELLAVK